ncbi:MBL fold metallo-hydrolase [Parapusillimonas granuli]|uniref:MBL fold metallo-hydrolase n=1 Tax=Parapusillimonas granuli TaxID=380911 RepID=A0A853FQV2_9BURK|nr:MBL fold metallo-hydrolase [Parapusillimonas granuli]MBB5216500.1 glyoxylase-like metal-dependent hydrolase (beta-lactamase superfamily II) [Parapusillimonas granuli]MEB2399757.1 MBL fold metallo-hydrolase [Alcaligenaceae bacterium]NYT48194.1 MBL fold metallo-hydrolase [Parapusillimonas granuli]
MNPNEMKLAYPFGDEIPAAGHAIAVADGVRWIRMPLPFALDHINLWLLRDEIDGQEGWTVVDCGVSRDEVKETWEQVFQNVLDGLPVLRVIVTHMHPDHVGLAYWLCERWNARLWMTMTDWGVARLWSQPVGEGGGGPNGASAAAHFARHGLTDPDAQEQIRQRARYYPNLVPDVPARYSRMMDGNRLQIGGREWKVIVGYGHAPEHASLYCDTLQLLISGDMVLPRISTNVSVFDYEPDGNPLPLYLNSLRAYDDLPENTLVLPSHGRPFRGLHERIAQQHAHHAERLEEVYNACAGPKSAAEIVPVMFKRQLDLHQLTFAMGEALAHLHALYFDGKLTRQTGEDGVIRFQRRA